MVDDEADATDVVLPAPCLVVLVGASGAGKSTWAQAHFAPEQVVSSDELRAIVGETGEDLAASADAFGLLEEIVRLRIGRSLTTVIDTLGLDPDRRAAWVASARAHGLATACVVFDTPAAECRARNRERDKRVPERVLAQQVRQVKAQRALFDGEGFDVVLAPTVVRHAPRAHRARGPARRRASDVARWPAVRLADPVVLLARRRGRDTDPLASDRHRRRSRRLRRASG